jgi:hypothetical protein
MVNSDPDLRARLRVWTGTGAGAGNSSRAVAMMRSLVCPAGRRRTGQGARVPALVATARAGGT